MPRKFVAYTNDDGFVSVVIPKYRRPDEARERWLADLVLPPYIAPLPDESDDDFILRVVTARDVPPERLPGESDPAYAERVKFDKLLMDRGLSVGPRKPSLPVDDDRLPAKRWRRCWVLGTAQEPVAVDLVKARHQVLEEIRVLHKQLTAESEELKGKADDIGTPQQRQAVREYRQALRDLPAAAEAQLARLSLAELEAYAPAFPGRPAV